MTLSAWLAFLAIAAATAFSPGPAVALALGNAMTLGGRRALAGSLGNALGAMLVGLFCLSALTWLLHLSPGAFALLRIAGSAYLVWTGLRMWRNSGRGGVNRPHRPTTGAKAGGRLFLQGLLVAVSNPKSIVFFSALLPQFIEVRHPDLGLALGLIASFAALTFLSHCVYVLGASLLAPTLQRGRAATLAPRAAALMVVVVGLCLLRG